MALICGGFCGALGDDNVNINVNKNENRTHVESNNTNTNNVNPTINVSVTAPQPSYQPVRTCECGERVGCLGGIACMWRAGEGEGACLWARAWVSVCIDAASSNTGNGTPTINVSVTVPQPVRVIVSGRVDGLVGGLVSVRVCVCACTHISHAPIYLSTTLPRLAHSCAAITLMCNRMRVHASVSESPVQTSFTRAQSTPGSITHARHTHPTNESFDR